MSANQLRIAAVKQLILAYFMGFVQMIVFFVSAGDIDVRPCIFFGASYLHYTGSTIVQYKLNPTLLVQRLKIKRAGSKTWDEILMRASNLTALIPIPVIAGLDVGTLVKS